MSKFDEEVAKIVGDLPIHITADGKGWESSWRSLYKHAQPHCRARLKCGDYCQNRRFGKSLFCRVHADIKFQRCCATTVAGRRCQNRPYKDGLCNIHLIKVNESLAKQHISDIRNVLGNIEDPINRRI